MCKRAHMLVQCRARLVLTFRCLRFGAVVACHHQIKLHMTSSEQADTFLDDHVGTRITPPFKPERRQQLQLNETTEFEVEGQGWQTASKDIVIAGLGWVSVTGSGSCKIRVSAPEGTHVDIRDALMPFDTWAHMAVYTGTSIQKTAPAKKKKSSHQF